MKITKYRKDILFSSKEASLFYVFTNFTDSKNNNCLYQGKALNVLTAYKFYEATIFFLTLRFFFTKSKHMKYIAMIFAPSNIATKGKNLLQPIWNDF